MNKMERVQELRRLAVSHAHELDNDAREYLMVAFDYSSLDEEHYDNEITFWETELSHILSKKEDDTMDKEFKGNIRIPGKKVYTIKTTKRKVQLAKKLCKEARWEVISESRYSKHLELIKPEGVIKPEDLLSMLIDLNVKKKVKVPTAKRNYAIHMAYKQILEELSHIDLNAAKAFNREFKRLYNPLETNKDELINKLLEELATYMYDLPVYEQEDTEPLVYTDGHLNKEVLIKLIQQEEQLDEYQESESMTRLLIQSITKQLGYNW